MIGIFDNQNYLKELVEYSSTFFCANEAEFNFEVIPAAGNKINFSEKNTIFIDSESEYGRLFEEDRYSYKELNCLRPNNIIFISHLPTVQSQFQFYPIDWIKVVGVNKKPKQSSECFLKDGLCMLGGWTPRRKIIYEKIINYSKNVMISYYPRQSRDWDGDHDLNFHCYTDPLIVKNDISEFRKQCIFNERLFTQEEVASIQSNNIIYSQLIPQKLFSSGSIHFVAETEDDFQLKENRKSEGFYVTEKSGKALFSGLPWVIYGAEGFLKNLKNLGFETFGDIIDESYDNVQCSFKRADWAAGSFIEFIRQPEKIKRLALEKVKERCIHNAMHISNINNWLLPAEEKIKEYYKYY